MIPVVRIPYSLLTVIHVCTSVQLSQNFKLYFPVVSFVIQSRVHCRQRAPVGNALSSSGTSQIGMFDIQATTKSEYYDQIVLLYLKSRRCRYRSIIFACFYLYITVVIFIDYSDIDKMMDIMLIMRLKSSNKAIKSSLYV